MTYTRLKHLLKKTGAIYSMAHWGYTQILKGQKAIHRYRHRERPCSFGTENPDKTFYIIGVEHTTGGLFAIVKSVYCHIYYALQKGYIPVVDMVNYHSQLSQSIDHGNAWEAFFNQPGGYALDDIRASKNIVKSASLPFPKGCEIGFGTTLDSVLYNRHHSIYSMHIYPNDTVAEYARRKQESVFGEKTNILGVLCRGTDYTENHPSGHPIQPTAQQAIAKAKDIMEQYHFEYVFLATEDKKIHDAFRRAFGDKLLSSGQKLYDDLQGKQFLSELPVASPSEKWSDIANYYGTIHLLSKCDGLLVGQTCGSICAFLMGENYKYQYFWDLGRY